jgi:dTDP-4-dehydrorhamnose reductase
MKIAVLGSSGMLGTALMQCFATYEVAGFDRSAKDLDRQLDITDREQVFSVLSAMKPDLVLNAAAYTAVDDAEKNPDVAMKVNRDGVQYLADFCTSTGARLVHFSTDYVFDGEKPYENLLAGYRENDMPGNPANVYGTSKLSGERALTNFEKSPSGNFAMKGNFYLVRTSWLFGPNGKNFVDTMLLLGQKYHLADPSNRTPLRVVNDQIGKPTSTFDLARATLQLIQEKRPFGIYHLVNEGVVSWYEFAREIFEEVKMNVEILPVSSGEFPRPAVRPAFSALENTLFPKLRSHGEALREYLKLYKLKP